MEFETITFETPEEGIGLITLNRPERLNAINLDMLDDLHVLFDRLGELDDIRVVIITGKDRGFCSGADLMDKRTSQESVSAMSSTAGHLMKIQKKFSRLITEMRQVSQPVIAAVNGAAAGGGMCIALAADIIIAAPEAYFIPSFINIGLSGGELGTSYFLPRLIGSSRAAEILLTGRKVNADEAERIGLISRIVANDHLLDSALETARVMLGKSKYGLRLTKEVLVQNLNAPSLESAIELENRNQSICCTTPDFLAAVEAFSKKG